MKLWVDDEREAPEGFERMVSSEGAIAWLNYWIVNVKAPLDEVSLDHDLGISDELPTALLPEGYQEDTGMKVLDWMIEHNVWPKVLTIHTMNPVARKRMLAAANAEAPEWVDIYVKTW